MDHGEAAVGSSSAHDLQDADVAMSLHEDFEARKAGFYDARDLIQNLLRWLGHHQVKAIVDDRFVSGTRFPIRNSVSQTGARILACIIDDGRDTATRCGDRAAEKVVR